MRLDEASGRGRGVNNFDLLRLLGAGLVLFSHSFALTRTDEPVPAFMRVSWAEIGVIVFFAISGFLIARSWAYDPKPLSFAVKRGLRLMPALVVSLLLTALILGPLATTLPVESYLENSATKGYVLSNMVFQSDYLLPGVFESNPYPNAVNGSLWTLPLELKAYFLVLGLGLIGLFGRWRLAMPLVAVFVALLAVNSIRAGIPFGNELVARMVDIQAPQTIVEQASTGAYQQYARLFAAFAIGAGLFAVARWVPLLWSAGAALVAVWVAAVLLGGENAAPIATAWLLPYVVLLVAYRTGHLVRLPSRFGDYSYGLYIFAFPVQQAIALWIAPSSGWLMFLLATPITLALAVASWHFVEGPALTLKQRLWRPLERAGEEALREPLARAALQPGGPGVPATSLVGDGAGEGAAVDERSELGAQR